MFKDVAFYLFSQGQSIALFFRVSSSCKVSVCKIQEGFCCRARISPNTAVNWQISCHKILLLSPSICAAGST